MKNDTIIMYKLCRFFVEISFTVLYQVFNVYDMLQWDPKISTGWSQGSFVLYYIFYLNKLIINYSSVGYETC